MKLSITRLKTLGVTDEDLAHWHLRGLVTLDEENPDLVWTESSPSSWPKDERSRWYWTGGINQDTAAARKSRGESQPNVKPGDPGPDRLKTMFTIRKTRRGARF